MPTSIIFSYDANIRKASIAKTHLNMRITNNRKGAKKSSVIWVFIKQKKHEKKNLGTNDDISL